MVGIAADSFAAQVLLPSARRMAYPYEPRPISSVFVLRYHVLIIVFRFGNWSLFEGQFC